MIRTAVGAAVGIVVCLMVLTAWGAQAGYAHGVQTARIPPGLEAAWKAALWFAVMLGPWAVAVGGVLGGLVGFGSWAARALTGAGKTGGRQAGFTVRERVV